MKNYSAFIADENGVQTGSIEIGRVVLNDSENPQEYFENFLGHTFFIVKELENQTQIDLVDERIKLMSRLSYIESQLSKYLGK